MDERRAKPLASDDTRGPHQPSSSTMSAPNSIHRKPDHIHRKPGHGAVAIVVEDGRFLVIRRSATVRAPNLLCFAGGTIEVGESPEQAIERELQEELSVVGSAIQHVWQSRTRWGTLLEWILVERDPGSHPQANPEEVSEWMWLSGAELLPRSDLLPSVPAFYVAWAKGEISLPQRAGDPDPSWKDL